MTRAGARRAVAASALLVAVAGCAGPTGDPIAQRPYLVAIDPVEDVPAGVVEGTLAVDDGCVVIEDAAGSVLPLFTERTAFGPFEDGLLTIDVAGERLRIGDEVALEGGVVDDPSALRSRYPGVDLTRCGTGRYALVSRVR